MSKLKHFLFLDFETFWSADYTLSKLSVPEYIFHPQFAVHLLAVYDLRWEAPKVLLPEEIPAFLEQYPAAETIACSHNALFDMAILAWKYGWAPGRMQDTLGIARSLRTLKRYSLGSVQKELFGHDSKGDVVHKVKGMNIQQIKNAGYWPDYCTYAMNDVMVCAHIYFKLAREFPIEEREVMDLVLRAAVVPTLRGDVPLLENHLVALRERKQTLLLNCGYDKACLMSSNQFQHILEGLGVEIEFKPGAKGPIPCFAKTDEFMTRLLEYDQADDEDVNLQVQALAMARLSFKSTLEESRAERFLNVAKLPWGGGDHLMPMPLRYGAAHTHRLGGEWKMNPQNLPRDKTKSKLRHALLAPPGTKLITADLSQIEARIVAALAKQELLVKAFADGEDVYASFASGVFGRKVTKQYQPVERFIGKTAILGLGYGCGWQRFYRMVIAQARQNNIVLGTMFDEDFAERTVESYRLLFPKIPSTWSMLDNRLKYVIYGGNDKHKKRWGPVVIKSGKVLLPNGMTLRYPSDSKEKMYGAKLLENITQALARIVIMQAGLSLAKRGYRWVHQCHDELVFVVPEDEVEEAVPIIKDEVTRTPSWLPGLPVATEIGVGDNYGSTK